MTQTFRVFVFRSDDDVRSFISFMREARRKARDVGHFMKAVVSIDRPSRSVAQNRRMWKQYLEPVSQQALLDGHHADPASWHRVMKALHLPDVCAKGVHKWRYHHDGERILSMSTGDLDEAEFEMYLHTVGAYAADELGVRLPVNPDLLNHD